MFYFSRLLVCKTLISVQHQEDTFDFYHSSAELCFYLYALYETFDIIL